MNHPIKSDGSLRNILNNARGEFWTLIQEARHYMGLGETKNALDSVGSALAMSEPGEEFDTASEIYNQIVGR